MSRLPSLCAKVQAQTGESIGQCSGGMDERIFDRGTQVSHDITRMVVSAIQ